MRRVLFIVLVLCLFVNVQSAAATSPCVSQTPEQFQAVKDDSDLIVHGQIVGAYRYKQPTTQENGITWLRILHTYKGEAADDVIKVRWVSYYPPLYTYDKDSEVVLLLKQRDGGWYLTDDSWKKCVPSVIGLPATFPIQWNGKAYTREEFIEARLNPEPVSAE